MGESFTSLLMQLGAQAPVLLVYLAGMILAVVSWGRHPGACLFLLIASLLLFAVTAVQTVATPWLFRVGMDSGWGAMELRRISLAIGLGANFLHAVGLGFLIAAVFRGRQR